MKDTNIEWIGKIPEDWNLTKVNKIFNRRKEVNEEENPTILTLARDGVKERDISTNFGQLAESYDNYHRVYKGDLMLNPMDLVSGANCTVSEIEGVISPAYINLVAKKECNPRFFDYFFKNQYWIKAMFIHGKGVSFDNRWTLNTETLMNYKIVEPPLARQNAISKYLDDKCKNIDNAIRKEEEIIALLSNYKRSYIYEKVNGIGYYSDYKKTEVEYIPRIPKHWNLLKGKYILNILNREVKEDDEVITCFRDGEVTLRKNRREEGFTFSDKEIGYQGIEPGDLVVHGMDGFAGAIGISDSRGKSSPVLNVLDTSQDKRYIMYYLRSLAYNDVFLALSTGIRVRSCDLSWKKLKEQIFLLPSIDEQRQIAEDIDKQINIIDTIIEKRKNMIDKLEEYRRALIYEAVSGKKEV